MTRRRMVMLFTGVAVLGGFSAFRLLDTSGPELPDPHQSNPIVAEQAPTQLGRLIEEGGVYTLHGETMGTTYTIKFVPPHKQMVAMVPLKVDGVLAEVNATMSTYDAKSELSLLNQRSGEEPIAVTDSLLEVLVLSAQISQKTKGAFDITVAPLVRAFGFGAGAEKDGPSPEQLAELRSHVGMQHLTIDAANKTVTKDSQQVKLDLSAVAKGYGVDVVAQALEGLDITNYMVEVGGEIRVKGSKPQDAAWVLAIEHPDPNARRIYKTLEFSAAGAALATSGDYRNFRKEGDSWISHTIDPRAGRPVPRRTASVSVVRPTAAEADALATGLGVLTPEESIAIADEQGWAVLLLIREGEDSIRPMSSKAFDELKSTTISP